MHLPLLEITLPNFHKSEKEQEFWDRTLEYKFKLPLSTIKICKILPLIVSVNGSVPICLRWGGVGFETGPKYVILEILKTVSSALFDTDSSGKCLSPQKGATHYYAQLGVPNKPRAIKG